MEVTLIEKVIADKVQITLDKNELRVLKEALYSYICRNGLYPPHIKAILDIELK